MTAWCRTTNGHPANRSRGVSLRHPSTGGRIEDDLGALGHVEADNVPDGRLNAAAVTHDERPGVRVVSGELSVDVRVGAELLDESHLQPKGTIEARRDGLGPETECHGLETGTACRVERLLAQWDRDVTEESAAGNETRPRRFMAGEPMKPATNSFTGES